MIHASLVSKSPFTSMFEQSEGVGVGVAVCSMVGVGVAVGGTAGTLY